MNFQFIAFNVIATKFQIQKGIHQKQRRSLATVSGPTTKLSCFKTLFCMEYKTARTAENVDWQTCQTKYTDILDSFRAPKALFFLTLLAEPFYNCSLR